jgi:glycosyltransferase involved in cell wall biosynthesis
MKPLVSILISAYNAREWIGYTLQSAVAQTWPRKEIIVVDDGSTDGTVEIARRFASKGVTIFSTKNGGLSAGQNCAYRHSQGDYLQFLDADDLLAPDKIERQLAALTHLTASAYFSLRHGLRSTIGRGMPTSFATQFGKTFLPWSGS